MRARHILVGALGALLLLGVFGPTAAGAAPSTQGQPSDRGSYVVQHEATVTANATNPTRTHRLVVPGAFVVIASFAAIAARRMASRDRRTSRRRLEEFHVRLRGPPAFRIVAH
jgi:hypothetical protein